MYDAIIRTIANDLIPARVIPAAVPAAIPAAIPGNYCGSLRVSHSSDHHFEYSGRDVIRVVCVIYIGKGAAELNLSRLNSIVSNRFNNKE